jgi:hypothetical protein
VAWKLRGFCNASGIMMAIPHSWARTDSSECRSFSKEILLIICPQQHSSLVERWHAGGVLTRCSTPKEKLREVDVRNCGIDHPISSLSLDQQRSSFRRIREIMMRLKREVGRLNDDIVFKVPLSRVRVALALDDCRLSPQRWKQKWLAKRRWAAYREEI